MRWRDAFRIPSGTRLVSIAMGLTAICLGVLYTEPEQWVRRALPPGQVSVVATVESFGPVWPALFVAIGIALIVAVMARRCVVLAHLAGMGVWAFYAAAIIIGAVLSQPPTPIVVGVIAIGLAWAHLGLLQAHQDEGHT